MRQYSPAFWHHAPAIPRKAVFTAVLLAWVALGRPVSAYADDTCTVPCVFSDGQAHTLTDGSTLNLTGVSGANMVTISGSGTSLVANDLTLNLGDTTGIWNSGINLSSGGTLSLTGGHFSVGQLGRGVDVESGTATLDNMTFTSAPTARVEQVYLGGANTSVGISNSQFTTGGDEGVAVADVGSGNTIRIQNDTFNFSGYDGTYAVTVWDTSGTLTIDNSTFHVLTASGNELGVVSQENTQIRNSIFDGAGAGIGLGGGISTISDTVIDAASGGLSVTGNGTQVGVDHTQIQTPGGTAVSVGAGSSVALSDSTLSVTTGYDIYSSGGETTVSNSALTATTGFDIYSSGGETTVSNSTLTATTGFDIYSRGGDTTVSNSTLTATTGIGVFMVNGTNGVVTLEDGSSVSTDGSYAVELQATNTFNADQSTISAPNGGAFLAYGGVDTINLTGGTTVTGGNGVLLNALPSNSEGPPRVNLNADGNVTLNGDVDIDVNSVFEGYVHGLLNLTLQHNSTLNGNVDYASSNGNTSGGNIELLTGSTINGNIIFGATNSTPSNITVDDSQINGHLSYAAGAVSTISLADNSTLNDPSANDAVDALNGMTVSIDNSTIDAQAGYALNVATGSNTRFTDSTASSANSTSTVYMNGTTIPLDGDTIINTGSGTAISQSDPTQALSITNSNLITNTGYALDIEAGSNVTFTDSTASSANGIGTVHMNGATIPLNGDTITNTGSGAALYDSGAVTDGVDAAPYGMSASDLTLTDSHLINTGTGAGLYLGGDANATLTDSTILAQGGDAIDLGAGNNNLTLDDSTATGGTLTASGTRNTVTLQNDAQLNMNVVSSAGTTDLGVSTGSAFTGAARGLDAITLDSGSRWNVAGNSNVNTLNLNGGTLNFAAADGYETLSANTLSGGGQMKMNTDLARGQGDQLTVGGGSGAYTLQVIDHSTTAPQGQMFQLVQSPVAGPVFSLAGGEADVGAYQFKLAQQNGSWYLYDTHHNTNTVNATHAAQAATASIWFDELQPLYARMGDLRLAPNNDGVWVRTFGSKERLSPANSDGVDTTLYMTEVGVDHGIHLNGGTWYLGATLGSGNVLESFSGGAGSARATPLTAGLYATWASNQGWYGDFVLKYDSLSQHYDTTGSGEAISANSHVNGVTASAEGGMRFQLPHQWFVEPQVELAALYQGGSNYNTTYGALVDGSGGTATTGRVSVMVGHPAHFQLLSSMPALDLEPYANFSLIRQFSGSSDETVDGSYFSSNVRETRGQVALGVSLQPVHHWQGFVELAYGKGQHYEQPWGFDVGVKKTW
jgi:outer membrane autotransporter protein